MKKVNNQGTFFLKKKKNDLNTSKGEEVRLREKFKSTDNPGK